MTLSRGAVGVLLVADLALLVATSKISSSVEASDAAEVNIELSPESPDRLLAIEYELDGTSSPASPFASLSLAGESTGPGAGQVELYLLTAEPPGGVPSVPPDLHPIARDKVDGGLGSPLPIELELEGFAGLESGEHTLWLLVHLEGDTEIVAAGEVRLGLTYDAEGGDPASLRIVEVR